MSRAPHKPITLRELAGLLELSQSTGWRIVNGAGSAHRIARETQDRVLRAAVHGYSANTVARSLRQKRTYTIGVTISEIGEGYSTGVLSGVEDEFLKNGFFCFVVSHGHREDLLDGYSQADAKADQELVYPEARPSGAVFTKKTAPCRPPILPDEFLIRSRS